LRLWDGRKLSAVGEPTRFAITAKRGTRLNSESVRFGIGGVPAEAWLKPAKAGTANRLHNWNNRRS